MRLARALRHAISPHWRTRLLFTRRTLDAITVAIDAAESSHAGQIRFAVENALGPLHLWRDASPRARAIEVFGALRVWDTERNNGVLIYVLLADRAVEIIADRGLRERVRTAEWEAICRLMQDHFRAGRYRDGSVAGVEAVGALLSRHFPGGGLDRPNELPDRPTLL